MRLQRLVIVGVILASSSVAVVGDNTSDLHPLAARELAWQNFLEHTSFQFDERETGLIYSLSQFRGDCQIAMIYDPSKPWQLTFKLIHGGKEVATFAGDPQSVFVGVKGVLYFAQYSRATCGCRILAFNTDTGAKLWERQLLAAGEIDHSAYDNRVTMSGTSGTPADASFEVKSLIITGTELAGDYMEVLDAATGAELAHKVYRGGH